MRALWGESSSYRRIRSILLRGLGVAYLAAFGSLATQVDGLIGSRGILPATEYLERARQVLEGEAYTFVPTVLWLDSSDRALHALCWGGVVVSLVLIAGILPGPCLVLLWVGYLSLVSVGQVFFHFQWDMLLLESGFLALWMSPWGLRLDRARRGPSLVSVWLFRWLVFRLMFLSGLVKLGSGDPTWRDGSALRFHYETQPLPTWTSWYAHHLPGWFQAVSVGFMYWAELGAPFLVFGPLLYRRIACASFVLLQALIAATGNYGFFNLLSAILCVSLLDDRDLGARAARPDPPDARLGLRDLTIGAIGSVLVLLTILAAIDRVGPSVALPTPLETIRERVQPFGIANAYGLFAVMTTERPEITVEGSNDGVHWLPYPFRFKPGDPGRAPRFAGPHMPRLDWQLWFAALSFDCRRQPWFLRFEQRLLEGSPPVLRLLADNPFPDHPPRFLRARLDLYHFTGPGDRDWWRITPLGDFCPPIQLPDDAKPSAAGPTRVTEEEDDNPCDCPGIPAGFGRGFQLRRERPSREGRIARNDGHEPTPMSPRKDRPSMSRTLVARRSVRRGPVDQLGSLPGVAGGSDSRDLFPRTPGCAKQTHRVPAPARNEPNGALGVLGRPCGPVARIRNEPNGARGTLGRPCRRIAPARNEPKNPRSLAPGQRHPCSRNEPTDPIRSRSGRAPGRGGAAGGAGGADAVGGMDRLEVVGRPDAVAVVAGEEDLLVDPQGREVAEGEHADRELGDALHLAEADWLGQLQAGGTKRLLGHLDAVERRVVEAEDVVERDLLLVGLAAEADDRRDLRPPIGAEPLDAEGPGVVEHPDAERLATDAGLGHVVDDRLSLLDGDDAGVRERAAADVGDEAAEREIAEEDPGVASPEDDVPLLQDRLAPAVPALHRRRQDDRRQLAVGPRLGGGRPPGVPLPALGDEAVGRLFIVAAVDHHGDEESSDP
jgi:hypothetical protein